MYRERHYREAMGGARFASVTAIEGESDLWIGFPPGAHHAADATNRMAIRAGELLVALRADILRWATTHPSFFAALEPEPVDSGAPPVVLSMLKAGAEAQVGPMAAVAGAIAEAVGINLQREFDLAEIAVENGGDLWISIQKPLSVEIYAGLSSLSRKLAVVVESGMSPCGLACSSGTVGPSLSFGKADAAVILAPGPGGGAIADAWATALGNAVKSQGDLERAVQSIPEGLGALAIQADRLAAHGRIQLGPSR